MRYDNDFWNQTHAQKYLLKENFHILVLYFQNLNEWLLEYHYPENKHTNIANFARSLSRARHDTENYLKILNVCMMGSRLMIRRGGYDTTFLEIS